jgi:hypothetical protein
VSVASRKQTNVDAAALRTAGATSSAAQPTSATSTRSAEPSTARPAKLATIDVLGSGAAGNFVAEVNAQSSNGIRTVV